MSGRKISAVTITTLLAFCVMPTPAPAADKPPADSASGDAAKPPDRLPQTPPQRYTAPAQPPADRLSLDWMEP